MPKQVCMGAKIRCSFGVDPSTLIVLPANRVMTCGMPAATILDNKPLVNILSFGMCSSIANPTVAAATSAALGVLTPMPCIPATEAPWAPGSPKVMLANMSALNNSCSLNCMWGGRITILEPGQKSCEVG